MSFQFNGFGSQSSPAAPRFAAPTVVASAVVGEDEESDGDEEEGGLQLKVQEKTVETEEEDEGQVQEEVKTPEIKQTSTEVQLKPQETQEQLWHVGESVNGVEAMSNAFVDTVQPSLDATIHRIAELKESQQRLLKMLTEQNNGLQANKQLEDAAVVLEKLPFYAKKLQGIKLAMQEISISTEKMKRRAEGLRIDAQSHAIKKENKRDAQSQWNKLYAAKSAPGSGTQT
uniref:Biogenesis of lysosome-related organelles complex 1 subunit 6 n=2 Tax=Phytophthora ramorum TaxID=164328 RepID=H3GPH6_PHYRM